MVEKYYKFDVDSFFEDYRDNQRRLERLKEAREDALVTFSTDYTVERVTNSSISDPTEQRVRSRLNIDERINGLKEYFALYEYIMGELDDTEKILVDRVLKVRGSNAKAKGTLKAKDDLCIEQITVYQRLSKLRAKVAEIANWT